MKLILQHDERDCGAACLAMLVAHYGKRLPLSRFCELTRTDRSGASLYGLASGAEQLGFAARALSGDLPGLLQELRAGTIRCPFIAHIVTEDNMLHYVVVYGLSGNRLRIADPGKGKYTLHSDTFAAGWTGHILAVEKTDAFIPGTETKGSLARFFALLKGNIRALAGVLLLSLLITAISVAGTFVFELVIDVLPGAEAEASHAEAAGGTLAALLQRAGSIHAVFMGLAVLYAAQALFHFLRSFLLSLAAKRIDLRLTLTYYNHLLGLPIQALTMRQTGEYLTRLSDASNIRLAISSAVLTLILDTAAFLMAGAALYTVNAKLFWFAAGMAAAYAVAVLCFRRPIARSNQAAMASNARMQAYFKETVDGAETLKAACAEPQAAARAEDRAQAFSGAVFRNNLVSAAQDSLSGAIELLGTLLVLWAGFSLTEQGVIGVGSLMTFYALLGYFTEPVKDLTGLQSAIQAAIAAADRLNDVLDLHCEDTGAQQALPPRVECWSFRDVCFRYGTQELLLDHICLDIRRGQTLAVVGESGSGKTTLARLLLRFYEPENGAILAGGEALPQFSLSALRRNVAYVGQDACLFADTIRNNLTLGLDGVSDDELCRVCRLSRAADFIEQLPLGYETPLDENGANLSGGQRQRLAIARALLRAPQLLILDEATSSLDAQTEAAISDALHTFSRDMACLMISHRLAAVRSCAEICVLQHGRIVERGTHEHLMEKRGAYWNLCTRQYGAEAPAPTR